MKNKLYDLYLQSPEWKAISDECKRLANFIGIKLVKYIEFLLKQIK